MENLSPVAPERVRYIKLGQAGLWEARALEEQAIFIGFGTDRRNRFALCRAGRWPELTEAFVREGRSKSTATRFTNEVRAFFEDDGGTLWITFIGQWLYWGFMDVGEPPRVRPDLQGVARPVKGRWRRTDRLGRELTKDRLSGALTKVCSYKGTSCDLGDRSEYVIRRVNGETVPQVQRAVDATQEMKDAALELMRLLEPRDFETLVDLVFASSGWRRLGAVGGSEKTRDLDLILPTTGDRAFVQVKSETTKAELAEYAARIADGPYQRMFFVYHTGDAATTDERVTMLGPDRIAEMVVDAGLVSWLIRKTA